MTYSCTNEGDLERIARRIVRLDKNSRAVLAACSIDLNLMKPQLSMRFACWLGSLLSDKSKNDIWFLFFTQYDDALDQFISGTIEWLINGKDKGGEGAGGFNQTEINILTALVDSLEE